MSVRVPHVGLSTRTARRFAEPAAASGVASNANGVEPPSWYPSHSPLSQTSANVVHRAEFQRDRAALPVGRDAEPGSIPTIHLRFIRRGVQRPLHRDRCPAPVVEFHGLPSGGLVLDQGQGDAALGQRQLGLNVGSLHTPVTDEVESRPRLPVKRRDRDPVLDRHLAIRCGSTSSVGGSEPGSGRGTQPAAKSGNPPRQQRRQGGNALASATRASANALQRARRADAVEGVG